MLCCTAQTLLAQQPAYFIMGEDQFSGVQIYRIIQDKKLNYWIATNEGLYYYNFYNFEKVSCDKAKSNSMFNFVINRQGVIYCHNLNNQIFKIENNTCEVFYELKSDEESADISLVIAKDDNLLVRTKKIIALNKQGQVLAKISSYNHYISEGLATDNSGIQFQIDQRDTLIIYDAGKFYKRNLKIKEGGSNQLNLFKFFKINNVTYAVDIKSKKQYRYQADTYELVSIKNNPAFERSESIRIYETGNEIWIAGTLPGTTRLDQTNFSSNQSVIYQNYFVSDIYKDHEGNILISTFDHGIIVIPDLNVPDVSFSFKDDPVVSMYSDHHQNLYLGTSKGHLINYFNGKLFKVDTNGNRRIEGIYGNSTANFIVYDNGGIKAYNTLNKKITKFSDASLKDAEFVSENKFYLGTNGGIVRTEYQEKQGFTKSLLRNAIFRIYALKYNATDSTLYAATSNGLIYGNNNSFKPVLYHSKAIFPQSLQYHKGKIYAIDNKNKILVIDNKQVIDSIIPIVAGKPEALNKIIIYNNTIIGRSSNGLFMFDLKGRLLSYIHSSFGFATHKIQDFVLHNNKLVVSHSGGVQQIDLNHRLSNLKSQPLNFAQISVNNESIDFSTNNVFHHNQNKIEFVMSYPTLKNREGIQYLYQLQGFENKWSSNNYEANKITYNALPAGSYTFTVKVENQSTIVASTSFSFTVSRAFYTSWWFIALCILVFLLLVYIIYRWQLKIHRKKSEMQNELSASKLSAIQSQMNPHFIFNALNSIQDLVLKGDVENSYSYITTFSDLVRRTLSYSQKEFIELDQEIKLLQLYLSLEKLRFKKNFSFEIETVNFEGVLIPPMLIQPFIENSLVHGLLHKEGEKTLKVYFELKEQLICVIEDNGVGREKARTIKQRQNSKHESFSGKAIGHRLEILSKVFDDKFGYAYEDLHDENGATGTRVILSIPVKRTF